MKEMPAGFREREHTADWELEVWAPDPAQLFEQAARGMYALSGMQLAPGTRLAQSLDLQGSDLESLLVNFLSELLYIAQSEGIAFEAFDLHLDQNHLQAQVEGAPLISVDKEIKAVTFHNLSIRATGRGLEVQIVFDV